MHSSSLIVLIALLFAAFNGVNGYPTDSHELPPFPIGDSHVTVSPPPLIDVHSPQKRSPDSTSSEEEATRKRRGTMDDLESSGKNAWEKVETAGKSAIDKAQELGGKGINAVESAGNSVATSAKGLWSKVEAAI